MPARFRHDPTKSLMNFIGEPAEVEVSWRIEPAVFGALRLSHELKDGTTIPVPVCATPIVAKGSGVVVARYDGYVQLYDHALLQPAWHARLGGGIYASPVVGPEPHTMVVATVNGSVALIDLHGQTRWVSDVETPVYASPVVVTEDRVAVATFQQKLVILAAADGEMIKSITLPKPWYAGYGGLASNRDPYATPVTGSTDNLVVATGDQLICFDADLNEVWSAPVGAQIRASPVASHEAGLVGVCSVDGAFSLFDETDGKLVRRARLGAKVTSSPALHGDLVVLGTPTKTFAVSIADADIRWSYDDAARDYTSYTLAPNGDVVFLGGSGNAISLDLANGGFNWETSQLLGWDKHDPQLNTTPVIAEDGTMYAASYAGIVYSFRFHKTRHPGPPDSSAQVTHDHAVQFE